ncbi:MAG: MarC family protein [Thermodesulfovibrionales bacterium]|jgi:multiple antibiotic resistance protein
MDDLFNKFLLSLIPIMVALNAPSVLPIYLGLTEGVKKKARKSLVRQSVLTALLVAIGFLLLGRVIFDVLHITVEDFMISGGILLLVIAITDIIRLGDKTVHSPDVGVVPLGTPLLAGPATLTTTLVLAGTYSPLPVILSLVVNMAFAWLILDRADFIIRIIGLNGSRALAKVSALLLSAIAVRLIRAGLTKIIMG